MPALEAIPRCINSLSTGVADNSLLTYLGITKALPTFPLKSTDSLNGAHSLIQGSFFSYYTVYIELK
jgi:hypothetical protein